jgi:nucleotide-binding universal stress UspA family protein
MLRSRPAFRIEPIGQPMSRKRRSYEDGHRPKFLVVIDDTPECDRALYFASRRAARVGAAVVMLRIIGTQDRNQQWLGVADIMKAEANEEAKVALDKATERARKIVKHKPEHVVREGDTATEILTLIENDDDISLLVLGAGASQEGPGPLVANLSTTAGEFPIPIAIVPGHLSDDDIDALA